MACYGQLDGEISARYAVALARMAQSLTSDQRTQVVNLISNLLSNLAYPSGVYLYSQPIAMLVITNSSYLFLVP